MKWLLSTSSYGFLLCISSLLLFIVVTFVVTYEGIRFNSQTTALGV